MRQLIVFISTVFCLSFAQAQKVKPSLLLYTPERIAQVKQRIANETKMAEYWTEIKQTADNLLRETTLNKVDYLAVTYLITNDKKYSDKIKEILFEIIKDKTWGSEEMLARIPVWRADLGLAHKTYLSAIAYDAVYNNLSVSERKEIALGLKRLALDPSLGDWLLEPTRIHSLNSMGHNWWTSCVCMGGILALSLQNELPEARMGAEAVNESLPEWFDFAGDVLQQKPKSFDENGGMYESLNYANFGVQEALQFRLAWKNTHPEQELTEIPQLAKLPDFFLHVCYPRTGMLYDLNFGDSHKNVIAESSLMLLYAMGIRNDNMLWYFNQVEQGQHRDGYFKNRPMGFLYTPDLSKAPLLPKLKKSQLFADFGWATMRDSVIKKEEGEKLNLWIDGQPKINASFYSRKKPDTQEAIYLKLESNKKDYMFYFSLDNRTWTQLGTMDSKFLAGGFSGLLVGIYATGGGNTSISKAEFDYFNYNGKD